MQGDQVKIGSTRLRLFIIGAMSKCPFCLEHGLLFGDVIAQNEHAYLVTLPDPVLKGSLMIIPLRHVETPFDLNEAEWLALKGLLTEAKKILDARGAQGYNVGWNVGAVAGQHVPHAHLHVFARFADEPLAGQGIRYAFKQLANKRPLQD